jgi:HEPN domain-containing protein
LDSAGYLSHLGIELLLKALLLDSTGEFHDDHSLSQLLAKLKSKGVELRVDAKQRTTLSRLDEFHRLRYPDVVDSPSVGDLDFIALHSLFSASENNYLRP